MKYILLFSLLFSIGARSQTCDSAIVIYQTNHDAYQPITFVGLQIDSFESGLLHSRYFSGGQPTIYYEYDSINRLKSFYTSYDSSAYTYDSLSHLVSATYFQWNGSSWLFNQDTSQVNYYYSNTRLDSIVRSSWDGNAMVPYWRKVYTYNVADTLVQINIDRIDTSATWYVDTLTLVYYTPVRIDSSYSYGYVSPGPDGFTLYDSLGRIVTIQTLVSGIPDEYQNFYYQCNQLSGYSRSFFGSHNMFSVQVLFDSYCRKQKVVRGFYTQNGDDEEQVYEYYYTSCNSMAVRADEDLKLCAGDTAELSLMRFGGTPPFHIDWNPNIVFPNDSMNMVYSAPDTTTIYIVTVTDSNGLTASDTLQVGVATRPIADIYISIIDTNSVCQSATLQSDSTLGAVYYWRTISSPATISNDNAIDIVYNETYILYAQNDVPYYQTCPDAADTFVFNYFSNPAPIVEVTEHCDFLVAHSEPSLDYRWYRSNVPIVSPQEDTLQVNQTGVYYVVGTDSSGCESEPSNSILYQLPSNPLSLSLSVTHPSCAGCSDGSVYINYIGGTWPYTYIMNGDTSNISYYDSLSGGLYQFCVIDGNGCIYCEAPMWISVNEIQKEKITCYPNPFSTVLNVQYPLYKENVKTLFSLYDSTGRKTMEKRLTSAELIITSDGMNSGIYFYLLIEDGIIKNSGKVILN